MFKANGKDAAYTMVSMESGLEGRNNRSRTPPTGTAPMCLNGVRPRRPEQSTSTGPSKPACGGSQWSPA